MLGSGFYTNNLLGVHQEIIIISQKKANKQIKGKLVILQSIGIVVIKVKDDHLHKGIGTSSRAWGPSHQLPCYYINRAHLCGLHTTQKFDKVHYYLYLTTDSPSYKYKHCCLCSLLLVTKCYGMGERRLAIIIIILYNCRRVSIVQFKCVCKLQLFKCNVIVGVM